MLIVRPGNAGDGPAILNLAEQAGPGFTSLAVPQEALLEKLSA